jgi:hypothetical protein
MLKTAFGRFDLRMVSQLLEKGSSINKKLATWLVLRDVTIVEWSALREV